MEENKDKKKKNSRDEEIEKAKKDMDELMQSIQEELGQNNVKVVQIKIPKANFKNFIFGLIIGLLLNTLLIVGTSGFFDFILWNNILDIVFFAFYFTIISKVIDFVFIKLFTPLIIKSLGIAAILPNIIALAIVIIFPIFVIIDNMFITLLTLVFIMVCERMIANYIQNKVIFKKSRSKK